MYKTKKEVDAYARSKSSEILSLTERHLRNFTIAKLYYEINEFADAEEYICSYLSVKEDNDQAHKLLGQCYQHLKKPDKALQSFQRSLQLNPKQSDILAEVCQLLLDDKNLNTNTAKYWCEMAESEKVQHEAVFSLRLKLMNKENLGTNQVEELLQKEIAARPNDVQFRVRLVRNYVEKNQILDAFKYVHHLEMNQKDEFVTSGEWYNVVWLVLNKYEQMPNTKKDWDFWLLLAICLERQVQISFFLTSNSTIIGGGVTETANLLFNLDQYLFKISQMSAKFCAQKELVELFLDHYRGQLLLHATVLIFKRGRFHNKSQWKETTRAVLPLLLLAYQIAASSNKEPWMKHCDKQIKQLITLWQREGSFRCAQVGRTLLSCVDDNGVDRENAHNINNLLGFQSLGLWQSNDELLNQVRQTCSDRQWRHNIFALLFCNSEQKVKEQSSLFAMSQKLSEPIYEMPSYADVECYEDTAQYLRPQSLQYMVYLCLGNENLANVKAKYFSGLNYSTQNLSFCEAESLNQLDVDSFLYAATIQAKRALEVDSSALGKPKLLPFVNIHNMLCTKEQSQWWSAAYILYKNFNSGNDLAELRANLQYGIEAVRGINGPKLDMAIVLKLGQIFAARAQDSVKPIEKAYLEARAESIYKYGMNMMKMPNEGVLEPFRKYFKYVKSQTPAAERALVSAAENAVSYLATRYFKRSEYEDLIAELSGIQLPFATYLQAEAYRKLDEASTTPKKSKRLYLNHAIVCLNQTLALLKGSTHANSDHLLHSLIRSEIKRLQQNSARYLNESNTNLSPITGHNNSSTYEDAETDFYTENSIMPRVCMSNTTPSRRDISYATAMLKSQNQEMETLVKQIVNTLTTFKDEIMNNCKSELKNITKEIYILNDKISSFEEAVRKINPWPAPQMGVSQRRYNDGSIKNGPDMISNSPLMSQQQCLRAMLLPANVVTTNSNPLPNPNTISWQSEQQTPLCVAIPSHYIKASLVSQPQSQFSVELASLANKIVTSTTSSTTTTYGPFIATSTFSFKPQTADAAAAQSGTQSAANDTFNRTSESSDYNRSITEEIEYDPRPDFKPIIPLPDEIEVRTGEEDEEVMFCHRVKLFRHVDKEWKERGIGDIKILKNKEGTSRILMRRDQTHKICANHSITPELILTVPKNETKGFIWAANDFADESLQLEKFFVRFKLPETAKQFQEAFKKAQKEVEDKQSAMTSKNAEKPKVASTPVTNTATPGSWSCNACYIANDADQLYCVACDTPKDATVPKKEVKSNLLAPISNTKFSFGFSAVSSLATISAATQSQPSTVKPSFDFIVPTTTSTSFSSELNEKVSSTKLPATGGFADAFKSKAGSWTCQGCYLTNTANVLYCKACDAPKGDTVPKKDANTNILALSNPTQKFSPATGVTSSDNSVKPVVGGFSFGAQPVATTESAKSFTFTPPSATSTTLNMSSTPATALSNASLDKSTFSFNLSTKAIESPILAGGESTPNAFSLDKKEFSFTLKPKSPGKSGKIPMKSGGGDADGGVEDDGDAEYHEEEENNTYFTPVIPLPDKIEVKTGEEDEELLYVHRAKLYRFVDGEWKERGLGNVKILRHKETKKLRVVMRREQILKICLNHVLNEDVDYKRKDDKSWLFVVNDFSEGSVELEKFSLRFKTKEVAEAFMDTVKKSLDGTAEVIESPANTSIATPTSSQPATSTLTLSEEDKKTADKLKLPYEFFTVDSSCSRCRGCDPDQFVFADVKYNESFLNSEDTKNQLDIMELPALTLNKSTINRTLLKQSALSPATVKSETTGSNENIFSGFGGANLTGFAPPTVTAATTTEKPVNTAFSFTAALNNTSKPSGDTKIFGSGVSGGFLFGSATSTSSSGGSIFGGAKDSKSTFGEKPTIFGGAAAALNSSSKDSTSSADTTTTKSIFGGNSSTSSSIFGGKPVFGSALPSFGSSAANDTHKSIFGSSGNISQSAGNGTGSSLFGSSMNTSGFSGSIFGSSSTNLLQFTSKDDTVPKKKVTLNILAPSNNTKIDFNFSAASSLVTISAATQSQSSISKPCFEFITSPAVTTESNEKMLPTKLPVSDGFGDAFKPKAGSRTCQGCHLTNSAGALYCKACYAPQDNTVPKKDVNTNALALSNSTEKFYFGVLYYGAQPVVADSSSAKSSTSKPSTTSTILNVSSIPKCEEVMFYHSAILLHVKGMIWKDLSIGDITILKSNDGTSRILIRRDQTLNICANHKITHELTLSVPKNETKGFIWTANDFAEGSLQLKKFYVCFKLPTNAHTFQAAFKKAQKEAKDIQSAMSATNVEKSIVTLPSTSNKGTPFALTKPTATNLVTSTPAPKKEYSLGSQRKKLYGERISAATATASSTTASTSKPLFRDLNLSNKTPSSNVNSAKSRAVTTTAALPFANFTFRNWSKPSGISLTPTTTISSTVASETGAAISSTFASISTQFSKNLKKIRKEAKEKQSGMLAKNVEKSKLTSTRKYNTGRNSTAINFVTSALAPKNEYILGSQTQKVLGKTIFAATATELSITASTSKSLFSDLNLSTKISSSNVNSAKPTAVTTSAFVNFRFGNWSAPSGISSTSTTTTFADFFKTSKASTEFSNLTTKSNSNALQSLDKTSTIFADLPKTATASIDFASLAKANTNNSLTPNSNEKSGFIGLTNQNNFSSFGKPLKELDSLDKNSSACKINESQKRVDGGGEGDGDSNDENCNPHYVPVIELPNNVLFSTPEEEWTKLFGERAFLFRWDATNKQIKESGVGELKILLHPVKRNYRLVMRCVQIHKLVLNHAINADFHFDNVNNNPKSFVWESTNYAESNEGELEKLTVRFCKLEIAEAFSKKLRECMDNCKEREKGN